MKLLWSWRRNYLEEVVLSVEARLEALSNQRAKKLPGAVAQFIAARTLTLRLFTSLCLWS